MPERLAAIEQWLKTTCELPDVDVTPVSGDASFRRYFRASRPGSASLIVMDAPPEKEDTTPFVEIARRLSSAGLHAPAIVAENPEQGFLLLEDLGDTQYLSELNADSAERLYGDALEALAAMQASVSPSGLPDYDEALLRFELELFREWLCATHLGLDLSDSEHEMLDTLFEILVQNALEQPQLFVHRDYHSRNLMLSHPPLPGIIDFQDAVKGPITYDLVSLLKDAYIRWPLEQVDAWAMGYARLAISSGLMKAEDEERFQRWFDLMGLQRHIKVAGIFARLYRRDDKPGYLDDIPLVLNYILDIESRYPEIAGLCGFIRETVLPAMKQAD